MTSGGSTPSLARWAPSLDRLLHYRRAWLRGDLAAGIAVAAYLVPQVMAYATVAGFDPVVGLWAMIGPLVVYAVLGSSRRMSVGPESTTAIMTAASLASLAGGISGVPRAQLAAALAIAVGVIGILGWLARLGFLAELLSKPVLQGYLVGICVLMVVSQLPTLAGVDVDSGSTLHELAGFLGTMGHMNLASLALGLGTLALLLVLRLLARRWPAPLIVMVAAALIAAVADLRSHGVALVGAVPDGLPHPVAPSLEGVPFGAFLLAAVGIALVGYSDIVLTARGVADPDEHIDANQEFLALGAINVAAAATGGFPVSCSGSRTALGKSMGSASQLYSLVALLVVLATIMWLGPLMGWFPRPALAAIVVYAALQLVQPDRWRLVARFRTSELVLACATALAVVLVGVLQGIGLAVALSLLDLLRRLAVPHDGVLGSVPGLAGMHDIDDYPDARQVAGLVVYRYDAPLFFANAENFQRRALAAVDSAPTQTAWFLLNAEANVDIDLTAVEALESLRATLADRGIVFAMARVKQDLFRQLAAAGFVEAVGSQFIFPTLPTAVAAYQRAIADGDGPRIS